MIQETDMKYLKRCIELAEIAVQNGDEPFGSVLVSADGEVLAEERNRVGSGDPTQHPEFALARWAAAHMAVEDRPKATVYTSGEHCPMCSAAHGFVGLGRIVYASSSEQLSEWRSEMGVAPSPVTTYPIQEVVPDIQVDGPVPELAEQVRELHLLVYEQNH